MKALLATMRAAFAETSANRPAMAFAVIVMVLNDCVWILFWYLFFRELGDVRGWDTGKVILLQAVLTTGGGITLGFLSNARHIGSLALRGQLDAALSLPVPTLAHVLVRRVDPSGLGDFVFGIGLFAMAGHPTPARTAVFVLCVASCAILVTSFLVVTGSIAFFAGRSEGGDMGFHALLLLSAYPTDLFAGAAKIVLVSVIPAAFVATVPADLIESFDVARAGACLGVAAVFAALAAAVFSQGLRRYTSGSVWTRA